MSNEISNERLEEFSRLEVSMLALPPNHAQVSAMAKELLTLRKALEGRRLVPVEPTRQMMSQGHFAMAGTDRGKFRRIYMAMVAAAPEVQIEN